MKKVRLNESDLRRIVKKVIKEDESEYYSKSGWADYSKMPVKYYINSVVDEWFDDPYDDMWDDMDQEEINSEIDYVKSDILNDLHNIIIDYISRRY